MNSFSSRFDFNRRNNVGSSSSRQFKQVPPMFSGSMDGDSCFDEDGFKPSKRSHSPSGMLPLLKLLTSLLFLLGLDKCDDSDQWEDQSYTKRSRTMNEEDSRLEEDSHLTNRDFNIFQKSSQTKQQLLEVELENKDKMINQLQSDLDGQGDQLRNSIAESTMLKRALSIQHNKYQSALSENDQLKDMTQQLMVEVSRLRSELESLRYASDHKLFHYSIPPQNPPSSMS